MPDTSTGSDWGQYGVFMTNIGEAVKADFFIDDKVDETRDIIITFMLFSGINGNHTCDGELTVWERDTDGSATNEKIDDAINFDFIFTQDFGSNHQHHTISASDVEADKGYEITWESQEAGDYFMKNITVTYYTKKSI